jgi:hypothetical protein
MSYKPIKFVNTKRPFTPIERASGIQEFEEPNHFRRFNHVFERRKLSDEKLPEVPEVTGCGEKKSNSATTLAQIKLPVLVNPEEKIVRKQFRAFASTSAEKKRSGEKVEAVLAFTGWSYKGSNTRSDKKEKVNGYPSRALPWLPEDSSDILLIFPFYPIVYLSGLKFTVG